MHSKIIEMSMSKPHTSVTALPACFLEPTIYRNFQMSAFKYFTKIECPCRCVAEKESEVLVPDCSIDVKAEVKMTQVECICSVHSNLLPDKSMLLVKRSLDKAGCQ